MLSPKQLLEQMLLRVVNFDGAHKEDSVDRAILQAEANTLFRVLRVIEESSGQRFLITAVGEYLDLLGEGMARPRLLGESDEDYRVRLILNDRFWNDVTIMGIKSMILNYYGIDMDNDIYDETRLVELYKQAACFFANESENAVLPQSEFGAEWLGEMTTPGAFEVHLRAYQEGDERLLKKRQVHDKLMEIRAAGVVVMLYFHLDLTRDVMLHPESELSELEIIHTEQIPTPELDESYEVTIEDGEIATIIAEAKDNLRGTISRRIVHDFQQNKCRPDYQDIWRYADPYLKVELENGVLARRPEPIKFRQSRLRNKCWTFYYGVKYEEFDITGNRTSLIVSWRKPQRFFPVKYVLKYQTGTNAEPGTGLEFNGGTRDSPIEILARDLVDPNEPSIELRNAVKNTPYSFSVSAVDGAGTILDLLSPVYSVIDENVHTYYTRKNPMVDRTHHYRGDDLPGMDFFSVVDYTDFWWRVASIKNGTVRTPSLPWKLTLFRTKEQFTRLWWRVITYDGREFSAPSKAQLLELLGSSLFTPVAASLTATDTWMIQLENVVLPVLRQNDKDLIVLDRYNHSTSQLWSRWDIVDTKVGTEPNKTMLSLVPCAGMRANDKDLSVVSSELLGIESGGYVPVKFWEPSWHEQLFRYVDDVIRMGFNGVVLDGFGSVASWFAERSTANEDFKILVRQVANHARVIRAQKNFVVVVRGGETLLSDIDYVTAINGVWAERIFFDGNDSQTAATTVMKVNALSPLPGRGKIVLVTDYPLLLEKQDLFAAQCRAIGFVPFQTAPM